ncbi:uncharacterized protein ZK1073.1-like isoform X2 [Panonychus citri]|uniref:uncharacterized protein ZK1073.1-like isoform X2 n=1 Tax=Panonychus citri TaxID=50023 RepID=UPI002307C9A0|nr:uncharacterized protein ZK1073.1-like isoform X2 [Panonychus citri]
MSINSTKRKHIIPTIYTFDVDDYDDTEEMRYELKTPKCGYLNVYVQGDLNQVTLTTPVFLTVHDVGTNHTEWHKLVEHTCMGKLKARSVWIHVEVPGQEFDSADLSDEYQFPSLQEISEDIPVILNFFKMKYCVAIGEGAGANIIARFAAADNKENRQTITKKTLRKKLQRRINGKNVKRYQEVYLSRTDISSQLKEKLKVDALVVTGSRSQLVQASNLLQSLLEPKTTTMVKIDDCCDVFIESPETFAYNLLLFCQGLGLFSALPMSRHGSICA